MTHVTVIMPPQPTILNGKQINEFIERNVGLIDDNTDYNLVLFNGEMYSEAIPKNKATYYSGCFLFMVSLFLIPYRHY